MEEEKKDIKDIVIENQKPDEYHTEQKEEI